MALFFKKSSRGDVGVVDLADLQRRGIFKPKTIPKKTITPTDSQGYADLSAISPSTTNNSNSTNSSNTQQSSGGGMFDWFSGLTKSGSQTENTNSTPVASSSEYGSTTTQSGDLNIKNKIDDVEFKMENVSRKLNNFLERLELIEKKINRLEGRGNY